MPQKPLFKVTWGLMTEKMKEKKQQQCFCSFTLTETCAFSLCSCNFCGPYSSGNTTNSRWRSSGLDTYSTLICCPTSAGVTDASTGYHLSVHVFLCKCPHLHEILGGPKKVNKNWCLFKIYHEIPESYKTRVSRWDRGRHLEVEHSLILSVDGREERQQLKRECAHFSHICDSWSLPHGW